MDILPDTNQAIVVDSKEGVGRVVLAARDLKAGEVILRDSPCVWGPRYVDRRRTTTILVSESALFLF